MPNDLIIMCTNIPLIVLLTVVNLTAALYNAARYKPAFLSSDRPGADFNKADKAVDGNYDGYFYHNSCFHTDLELITWWMVDLRGQFTVEKIQITNRNDAVSSARKLRNFEIDIFKEDPRYLTNFPNMTGPLCYSQTTPVDPGTYTFTCSVPIVGRFVRLVKKRSVLDVLHTCEIEVLVSGSSYEEIFFSRSQDYKMSGSALAILTFPEKHTCLQECLFRRSTSYCTAFNWVQSSRSCELFSVNPLIDLSLKLTSAQGTDFYLQN